MTRITYQRDADGALSCTFPDGSGCSGGPCMISYCEDGEREQNGETD